MATIRAGKTICLITNGHISSNPRLVKEAMALSKRGFKVHIIFTQYVDYLVEHDLQILAANSEWTCQYLNWTGNSLTSKINRLKSVLIRVINHRTNTRVNRNFAWQLKKAITYPADMYIAHNLGALPVAVMAAKKNNVKCGFDAEDFHRNEVSDDSSNEDVKLKIAVEDVNIPQLDYMTASSPQIAGEYALLYNREATTIVNVFAKIAMLNISRNDHKPLQLFWFSQTVGPARGIETAIKGIGIAGLKIELHLLGKSGSDYENQLREMAAVSAPNCTINFYKPVFPDDIFKLARQFDIGLALEPTTPLNRSICLTNKLFTYIQCGLAVIASNTIAQSWFLQQHPETGKLYNDEQRLANILVEYDNDRELLHQTKQACYTAGQTKLNWETESDKFIDTILHTI
jgi:glycosyltransferase involved in cell wall biosynthesis